MDFFLNNIDCKDPVLNAAIIILKGDKGPTGEINKFGFAAAYLTPLEPVTNNCNNNRKCVEAEISNTYEGREQVSATGAKQVRVSTGVDFR